MKFYVGNIVKVNGRKCVLEYANGRRYTEWSVLFLDDGNSLAWVSESEMEFVSEGSIEEIEKAKQTRLIWETRNRDLQCISEKMLSSEDLYSDSILTLFEKIGFDTSFNYNGEFFILFEEWDILRPIFDKMFEGNRDEMIKLVNDIFTPKFRNKFMSSFCRLFEKIHGSEEL